ncbi:MULTISPECIES: NAD-dependent epimerase/dehydratase family protein [Pseudomonas]|jgi:nucleoside-diphosphate-sugar epimerase|uniref:NAD-dependent epimerase/dehydratase family protein n=1 Tax=Pseudomonas TaxID=286 RepID=UPI000D005896|nr:MULTISPECIES: NAD-dependent epimerase/dehydratase family protein [Pseudomonas]PRA46606.1 epimerase [Pseudomonas sp. MYb115]QXN52526.1 NAD-dependent epimerase/dehydratase family protein [Pseudomonas fluorescens]WSO26863.1 NAD-dependent epimerase/dehydratase family protein [Pseudomonas fluorescens]
MRVLITGANGFVGRELVRCLLARGSLRGQPIDALLVLDRDLHGLPDDTRVRRHFGSVTDPALMRRVLADGIDVVFHLVSIPGGAAEEQYDLGYQVNLLASLELLNQLRNKRRPPVLVYASSVAVYGGQLPARMSESAELRPELSYGAHKAMVECAINDLARRGEVDGRALRLPGIVARPREPNGLRSAFMSDLMWAFAEGEAYCCPVSPQATAWWMSARCCVNNLIHAAELDGAVLGPQRVWQLPVLQLSIAQVIDALAERYGEERRTRISFGPDAGLEALFGKMPALKTPHARAAGFQHDRNATALVRNALNPAAPKHLPLTGETLDVTAKHA